MSDTDVVSIYEAELLFNLINDTKSYTSLRLVSRIMYKASKLPHIEDRFINQFRALYYSMTNKSLGHRIESYRYDMGLVCLNPCIKFVDIVNLIRSSDPRCLKSIRLDWLIVNPGITYDDVISTSELDITYKNLPISACKNIGLIKDRELTNKYNIKLPWDLSLLSMNPSITMKDILFDLNGPRIVTKDTASWKDLSRHAKITWNEYTNNRNLPWDTIQIYSNPNIIKDEKINNCTTIIYLHFSDIQRCIYYVCADNDTSKNMTLISKNPGLTMEIVNQYSKLEWDYDELSMNPGIDPNYILESLKSDTSKFSLDKFHYHPGLTIEIVVSNPSIVWNYKILSTNPEIKPSEMFKYNHLPWFAQYMSCNPSLTYRDIVDHPLLMWNWDCISVGFRDLSKVKIPDHMKSKMCKSYS